MALPKLKAPAINRKFLVPAGTVLVLVVLALGVVGYQHAVNVRNAQTVQNKLQSDMAAKATQTEITTLKAQVTAEHTKRVAVCDYVATKAKTRPTAGLIVVPVVPCT